MSPNTISLPHRTCSQQTRDKAQRLDLLMLTRTMAIVAGDHDDYIVWLDTMTCSCKAGQVGIVCSHRLAVEAARTPPPVRRWCEYRADLRSLVLVEDGRVVGPVNDYLVMDGAS